MPTQKAEPFRGSFMLVVNSKTRKVDVDKLRREIGTFLATRRTPRGFGACTTIQGPGGVVICDGGCTKPGLSCEPKKQFDGSWKCVCQKAIMQPLRTRKTAVRRSRAR
jgi:hypothetical protein